MSLFDTDGPLWLVIRLTLFAITLWFVFRDPKDSDGADHLG